jgi:SIR2-like domain
VAEAVAQEHEGAGGEAFEVPGPLAEAFRRGDLVIFAGARVGTGSVFPSTLAQEIAAELGLDPGAGMAFPDVMSAYEARHGRMGLLERIKERLDYARSFSELEEAASRFHRELASAFTISEIFTTDWDDLFERECAATPFAAERDWAFFRFGQRKVFKLHGSITSPSSVVATDADYTRCYGSLEHSMIWEKLETMLASKTVAFVGYSFRDIDFNALCGALEHRMGEKILTRCYVVTTDEDEPSAIASHMHLLRTEAQNFVQKLKECYDQDEFIPDERFEAISDFREDARVERQHMLDQGEMGEDAEMLHAGSYQDGLIHACEHIEANRAAGRYSSRAYVTGKIEMYRELYEAKLEAKAYEDVAYIAGYVNGLAFLPAGDDERASTPMYFVFGHEGGLATHEEFREAASRASSLHPEAHEHGERLAAALPAGAVFQHSTFLF